MVTIQVIKQSNGKPEKNARVQVVFDGLMRGVSRTYKTDDKGEAHIASDPGKGKVMVNGNRKFEGDVRGRVVIYI